MELDALDGEIAVAHAHDLAVVGGRRHLETLGHRRPLDRERMVAGRPSSGDGNPLNTPRPSWVTGESLPCITRCARHDATAERLPDRLVAEADAEDRDLARRSAGSAAREMPASFGVHGPGEMTIAPAPTPRSRRA